MKPRILNAESQGYCNEAKAILDSFAEVAYCDLDRKNLLNMIPHNDVLIVRLRNRIDKEIIDRGNNLKVVATPTTGNDHIDVEYLNNNRIALISLKGERAFLDTVVATAEHTIALMFSLLRQVPFAYQSVIKGEWNRDNFRGHELKNKVLGIVGYGRLGSKVANYAQAFGMKVIVYDPFFNGNYPQDIVSVSNIKELLANSDIVSIHVPLNKETEGMLGKNEFSAFKPGAYLINTSRGRVLDEDALIDALETHKIAGAALDVICGEENVKFDLTASRIFKHASSNSSLILTPHIGGATFESMRMTEIFIAQKIRDYFKNPEQYI